MPELKDRLKDLKEAIAAKQTEVNEKATHWETHKKKLEGAPLEVLSNPEHEDFKAADEAMKPLSKAQDELAVLNGQFQRIALMDADGGKGGNGLNGPTDHDSDEEGARKYVAESIGRKAIESDGYKELKDSGALADGSEQPVGSKQLTAPMDRDAYVKSLRGAKSLLTGQDSSGASALGQTERLPGIDVLPQLPLGIFELITVGQTDSHAVEFIRMVTRTIRAAETLEAASAATIGDGTGGTATAVAGGVKPESDFTFEKVTRGVKTIAHKIPATRQELADAPGLQTTIDGEMRTGVDRRAESQVVQGDGIGDNIEGILAVPGTAAYTQGTAEAGEPAVDAIHRIFTMLRLAGFEPSAYASHPNDWQDIRLSKDDNGNYIYGPPSQAGATQVWGTPVVQTIAVAEGAGVAGEWARAEFRVREALKVLVTDSHKDWFERNLLLLLAEARGVLVIRRPQAFGEVTFS